MAGGIHMLCNASSQFPDHYPLYVRLSLSKPPCPVQTLKYCRKLKSITPETLTWIAAMLATNVSYKPTADETVVAYKAKLYFNVYVGSFGTTQDSHNYLQTRIGSVIAKKCVLLNNTGIGQKTGLAVHRTQNEIIHSTY